MGPAFIVSLRDPKSQNGTHPALTELFGDLVMADGAADHDGPILPLRGLLLVTTDRMNYDILSSPGA